MSSRRSYERVLFCRGRHAAREPRHNLRTPHAELVRGRSADNGARLLLDTRSRLRIQVRRAIAGARASRGDACDAARRGATRRATHAVAPHFLFNSLNAIIALVRDNESSRAVRALSLLGDVLRTTVSAGDYARGDACVRRSISFSGIWRSNRCDSRTRFRVSYDVPPELGSAGAALHIAAICGKRAQTRMMLARSVAATRSQRKRRRRQLLSVTDDGRG